MAHIDYLYFADDPAIVKTVLTLLMTLTQHQKHCFPLGRDLAQDIHAQCGDIDQVSFCYQFWSVARYSNFSMFIPGFMLHQKFEICDREGQFQVKSRNSFHLKFVNAGMSGVRNWR